MRKTSDIALLEGLVNKYGKQRLVDTINEISSNVLHTASNIAKAKNRLGQSAKFRSGYVNAIKRENRQLKNFNIEKIAHKGYGYETLYCIKLNDIIIGLLSIGDEQLIYIKPGYMAQDIYNDFITWYVDWCEKYQMTCDPTYCDAEEFFNNCKGVFRDKAEARDIAKIAKILFYGHYDYADYYDWHFYAKL